MDVTIFTANPHTGDQLGREAHEPRIGIEVGRTRLAAHVHIKVQAAGSASLDHSTEHINHAIGRLGTDGLIFLGEELGEHIAVVIANASHHHGHNTATVIGKSTVGRHHLVERNLASTQTQRQVGLQVARNAEVIVHHLDHFLGGIALQDARRNPVTGNGKRIAQLRMPAQSVTTTAWSPAAIVRLRVLKVGAAWRLAILHGERVDKRFHRRPDLSSTGRHHIILEMLEVQTAHIGFHLAGARVHRHHATAQERLHVEHGIERRHEQFFLATVVIKHAQIHLLVEGRHNFLVAHALCLHGAVALSFAHRALDEVFLGPRAQFSGVAGVRVLVATAALVAEESSLLGNHVVAHGFLGMFLHSRVDGRVDAQSVAVDIVVRAVGFLVLMAPTVERVVVPIILVGIIGVDVGVVAAHRFLGHHNAPQFLAEVRCDAVLMVIDGMSVEQQLALLGLVASLSCEHSLLIHLVEHHIAACAHTVRIAEGVVIRRILAHTHQRSRLLEREVLRLLAKVNPSCALDAHGIVEEVKLIEVHLDDFLFGVVTLQFQGNDPLNGFLHGTFKDIGRLWRIELLGKLLRDGTTTAGTRLTHDDAFHKRTQNGDGIDARMLFKARVLGGNERIAQVL